MWSKSRFTTHFWILSLSILATCPLFGSLGCRTSVPIHTWKPAISDLGNAYKIAISPIAGDTRIAKAIEDQLLLQRPQAIGDMWVYSPAQLVNMDSYVQLASTSAAAKSELITLDIARNHGIDVLLQGEILQADIEPTEENAISEPPVNMNQAFFSQPASDDEIKESVVMCWKAVSVGSGELLGIKIFRLNTEDARRLYPEYFQGQTDATQGLLTAVAAESWQIVSPSVQSEEVRLARPWLQPGAWLTRRGVKAARQGQWQLARTYWERVVEKYPFSAPAQHNLAIAMAAEEDFEGAKRQLSKARGFFARGLPNESLFWIDSHHRQYHQAHGLPRPAQGWAFPDPTTPEDIEHVEPLDLAKMPWWTAIPFTPQSF
ncbi:MAG: hypothetical protein KDB03_14660 [Planctomycetales bacterium]|nr:hypothetical protein [Planctomycetales bacterium]